MRRELLLLTLLACGGMTTTSTDGGIDGSTPVTGTVPCGTATCDTTSSICCIDDAGTHCVAQAGICIGRTLACDQPADCPSNQVCCLHTQGSLSTSADYRCQPTCIQNAPTWEACQTDADCKETPGMCTAQTCGGQTFKTCSPVEPNFCH